MSTISWGTKIASLYIGFVALVIFMVSFSMSQKIELVSPDYYAKELKYQDKINEMNNANALSEPVTHTINTTGIEIQFPTLFTNKTVKGEIVFFCPSDANKDYKTPLTLNRSGSQTIAKSSLHSGMYKMQLSWTADNKNYFTEETIVIP
jgi:hypothetical protein